MIKAVLYDLDDTLLNINLTAFVARYLSGEEKLLSKISGIPFPTTMHAITRAYLAVDSQERTDDLTNRQLFDEIVLSHTGIPLSDPAIADAIECYEKTEIPLMRDGLVQARPRAGVREALEATKSLGLISALATNPLFSLATDEVRMVWAGVTDDDFAAISTLDNSKRSKPSARYYEEFCASIGCAPDECLMVGNDARRDFPHPDIGLPTAYVGHAWPKRAMFRGDLLSFAEALPGIVAYLDAVDTQKGCLNNMPDGKGEA